MSTQFKAGQVVFDKSGNAAEYGYASGASHIVYPHIWFGALDDDDFFLGDKIVWKEAFAKPPAPSKWLIGFAIAALLAVALSIVVAA